MTEIWKNKNGKSLKICLFTLSDEDDLIKDIFYFLTHLNGWSAVEMRVFTRFNSSITEGPTKRRTEGVSYRFGCPPLKKTREICCLPSSAKLLWFWFELQELDQIMPSLALALALSYTDANHIPKKLFRALTSRSRLKLKMKF